MALQFEKWEGTGNDFVLVDGRQEGRLPSDWADHEVQALCDRKRGVGADGVMVVAPGHEGALNVDFRNPDGSRSFCGNGTRSAFAWALGRNLVGPNASITASDGGHQGRLNEAGTPGISLMVSDVPMTKATCIPGAFHAAFLHTGSPHHVEWVRNREDLNRLDLSEVAPPIRNHVDCQPGGCNVNVVAPTADGLAIRTFERGVEAETLSCGTGVVAAALADMVRCEEPPGIRRRQVEARGGVLEVQAHRGAAGGFDNIWLFGAVRHVFSGMWTVGLLVLAMWGVPGRAGILADGLSDEAQVSVLTASPGEDLYAAFGHTAIRVSDPATRTDWVFNYGTFVVDEGFYVRFVRGRMDYRLGVQPFGRFQNLYLRQGRALHEQVLHLAPEDVRSVVDYLDWNAQPENQVYAYDFFRDNCATKVIAVLTEVFGERLNAQCMPTDSTYLEALRPYTAGHPWSAFGMELILGKEASTAMPSCGHAFLPDVLSHQLSLMTLDGQPLAFPVEVVFPSEGPWHAGLHEGDVGRNAPLLLMWAWSMWMAANGILRRRGSTWRTLVRRASVAVTAVTAAAMTLLFVLMQLATDHNDTWWNADVAWAMGGWGVLWTALKKARGVRPEDLGTERKVAVVWTVLALASVLVVPAARSGLSWGEATAWASVGACLAVVCAVWTSVSQG